MNVPGPVQSLLGADESVAAHVSLGGDDALYVTQSRTAVYHGEGLLSDESAESFPHDVERVEVSDSRRKTKVVLDYGLDGERSFAVPGSRVEEALHPVLAGVLNAAGVTGPGETVTRTYRFSELTLVVTSERVVKHVGSAVWDDEFEEIAYEDVTGLDVEEGSVASQLVIETTGRPQRIKAPNEEVRDVRERVEEALLAYHDVGSYEEFEALVADGDSDEVTAEGGGGSVTFESDLDTIDLSGSDDGGSEVAADTETAASESTASTEASATTDAGAIAERAAGSETGGTGEGVDADFADTDLADVGAGAEPAADDGGDAAAAGGAGFDEFESAASAIADSDPEAVEDRLRALRETIERQRAVLDEQQALVEELADELGGEE
jgi:hypothetical protein